MPRSLILNAAVAGPWAWVLALMETQEGHREHAVPTRQLTPQLSPQSPEGGERGGGGQVQNQVFLKSLFPCLS